MSITVVPYSSSWPERFEVVARDLRTALAGVPVVAVEHVGSTSVPELAAKPVLDVDVVVERPHVQAALDALARVGYRHRGDLGVADREALAAPDDDPARHVYVCVAGTLHLRNHFAVRDVLRARPDLRDRYGAVKQRLAADPGMDVAAYLAGKSPVLQEVLALGELTDDERRAVLALNAPPVAPRRG